LLPSSELSPAASELLLRRFIEASRRAEIIALMNLAHSAAELGDIVGEELCEACEAEITFILSKRAGGASRELVGSIGLIGDERTAILDDLLCLSALEAEAPRVYTGTNLLGLGARALLVAPFASANGERVAIGIARLHEQAFDAAEVTLLEAITRSVGHALERFWSREELLHAQSELINSLLPWRTRSAASDEGASAPRSHSSFRRANEPEAS
jgi:hypothetical protein